VSRGTRLCDAAAPGAEPDTDMSEKVFNIRLSISASIPPELLESDDFDDTAWLNEWEVGIKPGLIRALFSHLRSFPDWKVHIRNRGLSPLDEIEVVMQRSYR
jgi:hypothetical protein